MEATPGFYAQDAEDWKVFKDAFVPPSAPARSKPWERAPVSAHAPRLQGHKIWKRAGLRSRSNNNKENVDSAQVELEREGAGARKKARVIGTNNTLRDATWKEVNDQEQAVEDEPTISASPSKKKRMSIYGLDDGALVVPRKRTNANHLITPKKAPKRIPLKNVSSSIGSPQRGQLPQCSGDQAITSMPCLSPKKVPLNDAGLFRIPAASPEKPIRRRKSLRRSILQRGPELQEDPTIFQFGNNSTPVENEVRPTERSSNNTQETQHDVQEASDHESEPTTAILDKESAEAGLERDPIAVKSQPAQDVTPAYATGSKPAAADAKELETIPTNLESNEESEHDIANSQVTELSPNLLVGDKSFEQLHKSQVEQTSTVKDSLSELLDRNNQNNELFVVEIAIDSLKSAALESKSSPSKPKTPRKAKKAATTPRKASRRSTRSGRISLDSVNMGTNDEESFSALVTSDFQVYEAESASILDAGRADDRNTERPASSQTECPNSASRTSSRELVTIQETWESPSELPAAHANVSHTIDCSMNSNGKGASKSPCRSATTDASSSGTFGEDITDVIECPEKVTGKSLSPFDSADAGHPNPPAAVQSEPAYFVETRSSGLDDDELSDDSASFSEIEVDQETITQTLEASAIGSSLQLDAVTSVEGPTDVSIQSVVSAELTVESSEDHRIISEELQQMPAFANENESGDSSNETETLVESSTPDPSTNALVETISANAQTVNYDEDDTDLLRNFLTRVKANKEAKTTSTSTKRKKSFPHSPIKFPLGNEDDALSLSPLTKEDFDIAPSMSSPAKRRRKNAGSTTAEVTEPQSMRRSGRTRLPVKTMTLPAPSFIPVRRLGQDGDNTITLKRNDEKEVAALTKVNTRKNKGNAANVFEVLAKLSQETQDPASRHQALKQKFEEKSQNTKKSKSKKTVVWAEEIAEYSDGIKPKAASIVQQEKEQSLTEEKKSSLPVKAADDKKTAPVHVGVRSSRIAMGMAITGTPAPKRKGRSTRS